MVWDFWPNSARQPWFYVLKGSLRTYYDSLNIQTTEGGNTDLLFKAGEEVLMQGRFPV